MDRMVLCVAFLVLMASFRGGARAQSPPPLPLPKEGPSGSPPLAVPPKAPLPPEEPCSKVVVKSLFPCLRYVTPNSNETKPSSNCCNDDRPDCVCFLIDSNSTFPSQSTEEGPQSPNACNATVPPIDRCLSRSYRPSPAPPSNNAANPSLVPSAAAFLAGISLAIVAAFL
ncbi:unnamed protein product [Spirodela intermedia]|uniref:Bifunctional inhibitor/plant lipid transfer protein/seed storage helical domain-containing protein n=1 Tax=Spirodela intermedia TaxID=51605 RepID=A0A7I8IAW8_SPIIN|nr:unnamed protein product [Spirodela intermedia]CAA6654493.1 unnamed protein product [Spirodela intermedia]